MKTNGTGIGNLIMNPQKRKSFPEEPENIEQENPEIPQGSSKEGTSGEQTQSVGENPPKDRRFSGRNFPSNYLTVFSTLFSL